MSELFAKLRKFDAYPKTPEDFNIKTYGGAAISIISCIIMSLLFYVELMSYLTPNVTEELFVDTSRSPNIQINLDIIVPQVSCDFLALDAMDSSGEQHLQIDHNIYKRSLDLEGKPLNEPKKEDITIKSKEEETKNVTCGSCYGASLDPNRCCNTCEEVREAYRERRWAFPDNPENITQCKDERFNEKIKMAFQQGCQIYGSLVVNRVSGSFHIAPGKSFTVNHVHVHDVQPFSSTSFNTTHKIRHLSFGTSIDSETHNPLKDTMAIAEEVGKKFLTLWSLVVNRVSGSFHIAPGKSFTVNHVHVHDVQPFSSTSFNTTHKIRHLSFGTSIDSETHNPLKDTMAIAEEGATMFQYHIKIVPTSYVKKDGQIIHSNQFSVTRHKKVVSLLSGESGMPGAFFQYELSPLMVKFTETERSLGHFLTNVCAIIGGVYTVAGLIDSFLYHSVKLIKRKIELGKFH